MTNKPPGTRTDVQLGQTKRPATTAAKPAVVVARRVRESVMSVVSGSGRESLPFNHGRP
jgi:hypothetical protein